MVARSAVADGRHVLTGRGASSAARALGVNFVSVGRHVWVVGSIRIVGVGHIDGPVYVPYITPPTKHLQRECCSKPSWPAERSSCCPCSLERRRSRSLHPVPRWPAAGDQPALPLSCPISALAPCG